MATNKPVLPPNVSEANFRRALEAFAGVVGKEWVLTSEEDRHTYLDAFAPGNADEHASSGAIAPKSTEEVQEIVRIANRFRIPLWPVSTGRNLAYGGSAPVMKGTMVLDLKRMNRVLEIDDKVGYALVEPGVSFIELDKALQAAGGKLWVSTPAPGWGSVVGNALEHGLGYTPYGVHHDQICGMEVVLPNGDLVRTGMGAIEGGREWQVFKLGYGPVWDSLFTQSNFGIVTKMGIWLMPAPESVAYVLISLPNASDLPVMVDTLRPLRLKEIINATYTIMNPLRSIVDEYSAQGKTRDQLYQGRDAIPDDVIAKELARLGKKQWNTTFNLFDSAKGVDLRLEQIKDAFAKVPGSEIQTRRWYAGEPRQPWMRVEPGLPGLSGSDWYGGPGGHINFAPVSAPIGERVNALYRMIEKRFHEYGVDYYCGLLNMGARALIVNAVMFFNKDDEDLTRRGRELYRVLAKEGADMGFGDYRAHISFMDDIAAMYRFNNHALLRLNERIKDTLDPNGILAPGKQGIWPAAYRKRKS